MTLEEAKALATNGDVEAAMLVGKYYVDKNKHDDAIKWYGIAAEGGELTAMIVLISLNKLRAHIGRKALGWDPSDMLPCYLDAYKWGIKLVSYFGDTTTEIRGIAKAKAVKERDEAAYYAALCSYVCRETERALGLIPNLHDDRTDILRGVLLFSQNGMKDIKESFKLLSKISNNRVYGEAEKTEFEDFVYVLGTLYLTLFHREGYETKADLSISLDILKFVRGYVKNENGRSLLDEEISRYQRKFLGGYKYIE